MRTIEDPADPICQLVSREQPIGLDHLALAVDPLGLYGVRPRALLGQKAAYDARSAATPCDSADGRSDPFSNPVGGLPASVVPDHNPHPLVRSFELLAAPRQEVDGFPARGPTIH